jgi:DNA-binding CsgD family transcriptional regulator
VALMREHLTTLRTRLAAPRVPLLLGALGPRMLRLAGELADAARAYRELAEREGIAFERARAALLLGELGIDPREQLTEAYRAFDALGAGPWRRRAAAALRTLDLPVPRPTPRASGTLTDTEAQLVRLVSDGLTNRQIASAMHYSPKTVEVYLSRIYAKTQCASRIELIRALDSGALHLPG